MAALDASAWAQVRTRLVAYVYRRVPDYALAEDLVQDVLLKVAAEPEVWRRVQNPSAWLMRLTQRAVADHYRRGRRETPDDQAVAGLAEVAATDSEGAWDDNQRQVANCLAPLTSVLGATDREALRLVDQEGLPQVKAAEQLGISVSGMKSRVQRARRRLREAFLECCSVSFDTRGAPIGCDPRPDCSPGTPAGSPTANSGSSGC